MPAGEARNHGQASSLERMLASMMLSPPSDAVAHGDALTPYQASEVLGVERAEVVVVWRSLVKRSWRDALSVGWADVMKSALERLEGIATLRELAGLCERLSGGDSTSLGSYALTRGALEFGATDLAWRRSGVTVLTCLSGASLERPVVNPQELMGQASELRHLVSGLVANGDVVTVARLEQAVHGSSELRTLSVLSGSRLSSLAEAQIPHVLSNRRRELYLADLKPVHALAAVADTLASTGVTEEGLRRRVRGRFPGARPLPMGAALDGVVMAATGRVRGSHGYVSVEPEK